MPYNTRSRQHSEIHKSEEENEYPAKKERKLSGKNVRPGSPNHEKKSRPSSKERRASTGSSGSGSGQQSRSNNGERRSKSRSPSRNRRSRSSSREYTTEANHHPVKKEDSDTMGEKRGSESDKGDEGVNLEHGHIYFFYRPKLDVNEKKEDSPNEAQHLFMLLIPHHEKSSKHKEKRKSSLIVIGSKKLPLIKSHEKHWGSVVGASNDFNELLKDFKKHTYSTKTRGERTVEAARILGIGAYSISHHQQKRNSYLSYILTDPDPPAQIQEDFNLEHEGTFAISVKNPKSNSGSGDHDNTRQSNKAPNFPSWLQKELRDLSFLPITETTLFLNYADCQILLVGTRDSIGVDELGKDAVQALNLTTGAIKQKPTTKVIEEDLKVNLSDYNIEPLKGRYP
ncbi:hypothetical protein BJ944DRAFT_248057 [Cunninghamella echinulata]|nr:hypothetical protein BJ944DRAFT_248057 [Cunninghamella echinulata]